MIAFKSATELAQMLRDRQISARELFAEYEARADRFNKTAQRDHLERSERREPRARGRREQPARRAADDGEGIVRRHRRADHVGHPGIAQQHRGDATPSWWNACAPPGANVFGKTNVPLNLGDFQSYNVIYGTTNNPWDTGRTPGGSSGGSAAALAAGLTALEIGSDIGGSIRNPAHFCGVFGHKPTYRLIPARGHAPPGVLAEPEIAVVGPLARSAADLDLALDVLAKPDRLETGLSYDLPRLDGRKLKDLESGRVGQRRPRAGVARRRARRAESGRRIAPRGRFA